MRKWKSAILAAVLLPVANASAVNYVIDDGRAELAVTIDPAEDQIWFNTFPVVEGGEVITAMSVGFGRPGLFVPLNGLPVTLLIYEDVDGGSPLNATLLRSVDVTVESANSITLPRYEIPPTIVHGTMLAAALFRNTTEANQPIAGLDRSPPTFTGRSWVGFAVNLNESDLTSIPSNQIQGIEGLGVTGNFIVRAEGVPLPEPGAFTFGAAALLLGGRMCRRWKTSKD